VRLSDQSDGGARLVRAAGEASYGRQLNGQSPDDAPVDAIVGAGGGSAEPRLRIVAFAMARIFTRPTQLLAPMSSGCRYLRVFVMVIDQGRGGGRRWWLGRFLGLSVVIDVV